MQFLQENGVLRKVGGLTDAGACYSEIGRVYSKERTVRLDN